jgi:hypothetical protein
MPSIRNSFVLLLAPDADVYDTLSMSIRPVVLLVGALFVMPGARFTSIRTFRASSGISCTVRCDTLLLIAELEVSSSGVSPVTCTESVTWPTWRAKSAVVPMPVLTTSS